MTAAELLERAERRAVYLKWVARASGALMWVLAGAAVGVAVGQCSRPDPTAIVESKRETAVAQVARAAAVETVTVRIRETAKAEAKALPLHDTVRVVDSVTILVARPDSSGADSVTVPAPIVARIVADSQLITAQRLEILALARVVSIDSAVIRSQASTIKLLESGRQRCGRKCGIVVGVVSSVAAIAVTARIAR